MRAKSRSNIGMVRILRDMLDMEGADKEFLLAEITRLTHGRDALFDMRQPPAKAPAAKATTTTSTTTLRQRRMTTALDGDDDGATIGHHTNVDAGGGGDGDSTSLRSHSETRAGPSV